MVVSHTAFKKAVLSYVRRTGIAQAAFGRQALSDPNFVSDLRAGRRPRAEIRERVMAWMEQNPAPTAAE